VALRARQHRGVAEFENVAPESLFRLGEAHFDFQCFPVRGRDLTAPGSAVIFASRNRHQQSSDVGDRQTMVHVDMPQSVPRQRRNLRLLQVLNDRQTACGLDRGEAGDPVVEAPRQQDADHPVAECEGCRAEQRIDGGPEAILSRAERQAHPSASLDQQMAIDRRHVHHARLKLHAVLGMLHLKGTCMGENLGKQAGSGRRGVDHDEHCHRDVTRQGADQRQHRFYTAGGPSDHNHIAFRHCAPPLHPIKQNAPAGNSSSSIQTFFVPSSSRAAIARRSITSSAPSPTSMATASPWF
jgi:hypothetical protein